MLQFDESGLIAAVAQDHLTGEVRMVGWMNQQALSQTLQTGRATFFSRSRQRLWVKGESSGNFLEVVSVLADCDADTLLLRVLPKGPTCHTGRPTCFFRRLAADGTPAETESPGGAFSALLEHELVQRARSSSSQTSYTKTLLDAGAAKIGEKVREEADEFSVAIAAETDERVANEAADVLYHLMVGLQHRGVSWRQVMEVLASRSGVSGLVEKATRSTAKTSE